MSDLWQAFSFWVRLLMEKFLFQRPLCRVRKVLALEGLSVSQGTLTGGLKRIGERLQPVHTCIRYCGRDFTADEMDQIRHLIASDPQRNRAQLSRLVCDRLGWLRPDGRRKDMSCRVAMIRMERDGLMTLPPPQKRNGNGRQRPRFTEASDPKEHVSLPAGALGQLLLCPVDTPRDSSLWNELIERYHYLGYKPPPGAQMRYLVFSGPHLLAANWIHVGQTQGRGKLDRTHRYPLPVKDIYLYPIHKHFRQRLSAENQAAK